MLETIPTLSDTKNHPFNEKKSFFFNHNPYFAQVSIPAWGYHVVTNFPCTPKRVVEYLVHNARKLYCASLFGTIRKINLKQGWNRKPRNPECQKYIGSYGKSAKGSAEFRFGSFFKISFHMVPNKLAQYNFQAL